MRKKFSYLLLLTLIHINTHAQFSISSMLPEEAVATLMGPEVNYFNVQFTGDPIQLGWTYNVPGNFETQNGLILSTSAIQNFFPNIFDGEPTQPINTEVDLLTIANEVPPLINQTFLVNGVFDVAILEFDFIAPSEIINLNFTYGSDEYLTYVNSQYNDVFAILISGPGLSGPYASPLSGLGAQNIAIVPGSNPALPITISSVNNTINSEYYIDNPINTINNELSLTGYTSQITSTSLLIPGQTYHLKLAIADGSDNDLKSQMVLNLSFDGETINESCAAIVQEEVAICQGESTTLNAISSFYDGISFDNGIYIPDNQGCLETELVFDQFGSNVIDDVSDFSNIYFTMEHSFVGDITISVICPDGSVMNIFPEAGGSGTYLGEPIDDESGTPGVGYTYSFSPNSIGGTWMDYLALGGPSPIPAGDYAPEGSFTDLIGCPINGIWTLEICDIVGADDGFLFEFGIQFSGIGLPSNYSWSTGETNPTISVAPSTSTMYYLYSEANGINCVDSVWVSVFDDVQISSDSPLVLCGDNTTINLIASGADSYVWSNGSIGPNLIVSTPGVYSVTGISNACSSTESITITANTSDLFISADTTEFCSGDTVTLYTTGAIDYLWSNGATSESIQISSGGVYSVVGIDALGCEYTSNSVFITEYPIDLSISSSSSGICDGQSVVLSIDPGNQVEWSTGESTSSIIVTNPGSYSATVFNGPCSGTTDVITLNLGATPSVSAESLEDSLCINDPAALLLGSPVGGIWSGIGVEGNFFVPEITGIFTVTYSYTNDEGCTGTAEDSIVVYDCNGVYEYFTLPEFNIFPNPANEILFVNCTRYLNNYTIEIMDMSGRLVYSTANINGNTAIDISTIAPGHYTIRLLVDSSKLVIPIIKL
jgi:subtilisin-like proprotein convertase family protein